MAADVYVADASTDEEYAVLKDYFDCLTSEKSLQNAADIRLLSGIILRDKAELGVLESKIKQLKRGHIFLPPSTDKIRDLKNQYNNVEISLNNELRKMHELTNFSSEELYAKYTGALLDLGFSLTSHFFNESVQKNEEVYAIEKIDVSEVRQKMYSITSRYNEENADEQAK